MSGMVNRKRKAAMHDGKTAYPDFSAAMAAATALRHNKGGQISPYACPYCHDWHVGHTSARRLANA